jgi:hypothetical protein
MVRGPACGSELGTISANHAAFPRLALLRNRSVRARLRSSLTAPVCGFAAFRRRRFAPTVPSPLPQVALAKCHAASTARAGASYPAAQIPARPTRPRSAATALPPRRLARAESLAHGVGAVAKCFLQQCEAPEVGTTRLVLRDDRVGLASGEERWVGAGGVMVGSRRRRSAKCGGRLPSAMSERAGYPPQAGGE